MTIVERKKVTRNKNVQFTAKLSAQLSKSEENAFSSPLSVHIALGMCAAGATDETQEELSEFLLIPAPEQAQVYSKIVASFSDEKSCELKVANALWCRQEVEFKEKFIQETKEVFQATCTNLDYSNKATAAGTINQWCSDNTNEKITNIIDPDALNTDTILVLTNAIYFKGKWQNQFDKKNTKPKNFHTPSGDKDVSTMYLRGENLSYLETEAYQALDLPYEGDNLSMLIVLPKEDSTEGLDNDLERVYVEACENLRNKAKVNVYLPKFKMETEYKLGQILKKEIPLSFSDNAQFNGITVHPKDRCKISEVIHKAFVACDEEGTEAAAVTAVLAVRCASFSPKVPPIEFVADHPFLFFIRNSKTNDILFCGRVANP